MPGTYKDIQKRTGLSLSTISKYFNGGHLREENRSAIEKAIRDLDFRVNAFARSLKSRRSGTIGILIPELSSTFNSTIMERVCETLRKHGYGSIVCTCNGRKDAEKSSLSFLLDKMVDGIITIPIDESGTYLKAISDQNVPIVLIGHLAADFKTDAVIVNNREAGRTAAREFLSHGHTSLGILCGPKEMDTMRLRSEGFIETLKGAGGQAFAKYCQLTLQSGYIAAKSLLTPRSNTGTITGIFCTNYELTLGAYIAIQELHKRIPEEISVIGFDNMLLSGILQPSLTMIIQPVEKIADTAAELMLKRLADPENKKIRIAELRTQLLHGSSVAPL